MAEKRMFSKTIIDSDAFLDMPLSSQALYFHLSMRADDDGFVNNPKKIQRIIGCADDDLKLLMAKKFLIPFESGIVVIKHWRIHNYIRSDRYKETNYTEEKSMLGIEKNKTYSLLAENNNCTPLISVSPNGIPTVDKLDTQNRLDKNRLDKDRLEEKNNKKKKKSEFDDLIENYTENLELRETLYEFIKMRKTIKSQMTSNALKLMLNKLDKLSEVDDEKIEIINNSIMNCWKGIFPLKNISDAYGNNRTSNKEVDKSGSARQNINSSEEESKYNFDCY